MLSDLLVTAADKRTMVSCIVILVICLNYAYSLTNGQEIALIKSRIYDVALKSRGSRPYTKVQQILDSMNADGSFNDIDYTNNANRGSKPFTDHGDRLNDLATSYYLSDNGTNPWYLNATLLQRATTSYEYLSQKAPPNEDTNWWGHQIGLPGVLWKGIVVLENDLPRSLMIGILDRYWKDTKVFDPPQTDERNGGSNLAYRMEYAVFESLLRSNSDFTTRHPIVMELLERELIDRNGRGLTGLGPDSCLYQHNIKPGIISGGGYNDIYRWLVYNGEYSGAVDSSSRLANYFRGTSFQFKQAALEGLHEALLDCHQWLKWNSGFEPTSTGRKLGTKSKQSKWAADSVYNSAVLLLPLNIRTAEIQKIINRHGYEKPSPTNALLGNRGFFRAGMMVHRRLTYMAAVRLLSTYTSRPETWTTATPRGYFTGDGFLSMMQTGRDYGRQYNEVFLYYDWARIPGATFEYTDDVPIYQTGNNRNLHHHIGNSTFVGTVTDNQYGAAAMEYKRNTQDTPAEAKKAWIFFDNEVVALGTDIHRRSGLEQLHSKANNIATTLNQIHHSGPIQISVGGTIQNVYMNQSKEFNNPSWVLHNKIAYVFREEPGKVVVQSQRQSLGGESGQVFTAYIDHGLDPQNRNYIYCMVPGLTEPSDVENYIEKMNLRIIENSRDKQAVEDSSLNRAVAIFYKAGSVTVLNGISVTAESECLTMLHVDGKNYTLSVSHPVGTIFKIKINKRLQGHDTSYDPDSGLSTITFTLPTNDYKGKSEVRHLMEN